MPQTFSDQPEVIEMFNSPAEVIEMLKRKRLSMGMTQTATAKAMSVPGPTLCRLERGTFQQPPLDLLTKYAHALNLKLTCCYSVKENGAM